MSAEYVPRVALLSALEEPELIATRELGPLQTEYFGFDDFLEVQWDIFVNLVTLKGGISLRSNEIKLLGLHPHIDELLLVHKQISVLERCDLIWRQFFSLEIVQVEDELAVLNCELHKVLIEF